MTQAEIESVAAEGLGRSKSFWGAVAVLLLLVPMPSLSVAVGLGALMQPGPLSQAVFIAAKVWLLGLPVAWWVFIDKQKVVIPEIPKKGLLAGFVVGLITVAVIFGAYFIVGVGWIDVEHVREVASGNKLDVAWVYITAAVYFCLVNSLLEEYVWRWFVYRKSEIVLSKMVGGAGKYAAVFASALFFTLHHIVALRIQFDWNVTILASLGVFIGGSIWSGFYMKYQSIWPGYVAHVLADIPIFVIGWWIIFG